MQLDALSIQSSLLIPPDDRYQQTITPVHWCCAEIRQLPLSNLILHLTVMTTNDINTSDRVCLMRTTEDLLWPDLELVENNNYRGWTRAVDGICPSCRDDEEARLCCIVTDHFSCDVTCCGWCSCHQNCWRQTWRIRSWAVRVADQICSVSNLNLLMKMTAMKLVGLLLNWALQRPM